MVRRLGLIAFANNGGLGAQTRRLAAMLKPERVLVVDSKNFSRNPEQHFEWYASYSHFISNGFPSNKDVQNFLQGLTHVFTCENPYNFNLIYWAHKYGIKSYCQSNYEFCENLDKPYLPVPTKFLMPSHWMVEEMKQTFGDATVDYLPPPINPDEFQKPREVNFKRNGKVRFLHVLGTAAAYDRNGTLDLIDSVKLAKSDFELVIKSQHPVDVSVFLDDPRVTYEFRDAKDNSELYEGFDALLLPRRYGGLCLTCNEALMSAMPVIMPDISPNNQLLPKEWVVEAKTEGKFQGRSLIPLYSVDHQKFANKIDELVTEWGPLTWDTRKSMAYQIAIDNFSEGMLEPAYDALWI